MARCPKCGGRLRLSRDEFGLGVDCPKEKCWGGRAIGNWGWGMQLLEAEIDAMQRVIDEAPDVPEYMYELYGANTAEPYNAST